MKIVDYKNCENVVVEFQDEYKCQKNTTYVNFKRGQVKNPYDKTACGVGYVGEGKYLTTMHKMHRADTDNYISTNYKPANKTNVRRLTPVECERLQTLPDNYTKGVSDTNRYKCIGNGWTVDIIAHILSYLK